MKRLNINMIIILILYIGASLLICSCNHDQMGGGQTPIPNTKQKDKFNNISSTHSDITPELYTQRVVTVNRLMQVYGKLTQKKVVIPPDIYFEEVIYDPDVSGSDEEKVKRIKAILATNDIVLQEVGSKLVKVDRVRSVKYWKNLNRQFQNRQEVVPKNSTNENTRLNSHNKN